MDLQNAWSVASKDFETFKRRKGVIYATIAFPLGIAFGFPGLIFAILHLYPTTTGDSLTPLLDAFSFWFVIGAATLPSGIASYSIAGEKLQKSLEPLLATPMTDGEILLGKCAASFVPSMASIYAGAVIFMTLMDIFTRTELGIFTIPIGALE